MSETTLTLRQNWWLLCAALAALLPLSWQLPAWLPASAALAIGWRALITWRGMRLPPRWLLALLVAAGCAAVWMQYRFFFGRQPGLAMLVILLSLKLLELRRPRDGMAVILLACFLLLSGFFFSQNLPAAALALLGLVLVIAALHALQDDTVALLPALRLSARMLLFAAPLALLFFLLFPRVQGPLWGLPQDASGASSGLSERMRPGSISQVAQSDALVFRARFDGDTPPLSQLYWRAQVLTDYDGVEWRPRKARDQQLATAKVTTGTLNYELVIEPHPQHWFFALESITQQATGTRYTDEQVLIFEQPPRTRQIHAMSAQLNSPQKQATTPPKEAPTILAAALRLPPQGNPRTRAIAAEWQQQNGKPRADTDILASAENFFQNQLLAYTLSPPLMLENSVDAFLFEHKRGFCEHFASAFVFAMRAAGVPARVVGGYQGGEINPVDGYVTVRQYDAHAWAEVWLQARGWVRIDPTVAGNPRRIEAGISAALPDSTALPLLARNPPEWLREMRYQWESLNGRWQRNVVGFNPQRQRELLAQIGMPDPDWKQMGQWLAWGTAALFVLYLLLAQRWHKPDPLRRDWQRFLRRLHKRGIHIEPWMGPETVATQAIAQLPAEAATIRSIVADYIALRYAANPLDMLKREFGKKVRTFK